MSVYPHVLVESAMKYITSIFDLLNSDLVHEAIGKLREICTRSNVDKNNTRIRENKNKDKKTTDNSA